MELPQEVVDDLRKRLHRVVGQVNGIEQMLNEGRECREIVTQISAASSALSQVGFRLVATGVKCCLTEPERAAEAGYEVEQLEKLFLKLK